MIVKLGKVTGKAVANDTHRQTQPYTYKQTHGHAQTETDR